ncbi:HAD-like domain-containing protein [Xylariales sp. AK1849]|nr:HAD-like domain-containing protein [Xylariales sp. AK1849]
MTAESAVRVVLLDIEGTVCPISFVRDVLFPYALKVLPKTIETEWDSQKFREFQELFPTEYSSNREAFEAHVIDLVTRDVKASYVKTLQGYLWEEGYKSGELRAPLFPDVPPKLARWHGKDKKLMIYSSGSVPAQKLLFGHTDANPSDFTGLISDWFDTTSAGLKTEAASYETIASKHPEYRANEFLFLSDNVKEVDAAIRAGMRSIVVQRPGNADLPSEVYERLQVVETFDTIEDDFNIETMQQLGKRDRPSAEDAGDDDQIDDDSAETIEVTDETHEAKRPRISKEEGVGAVGSKQGKVETNEKTSRMDELLAEAVGEAPATTTDSTTGATKSLR